MLLCCFRDSNPDKDDSPRSGRRHKYRDDKSGKQRANTNPGLTRDSSISRLSACNEGGVILAPITFHPVPTSSVESRPTFLPPPYNRSTSACSNSEQYSHSLSRQSSQQSNSQYGQLVRPHSRDGSRRDKERAPLSKEAKRLLKQRSQESFASQQQQHHQTSGGVENNSQSVSSIPFIDQTPPSAKQAHHDDDSKEGYSITSTSPLRQFAEEKRRRSHCSTVSTPNLPVTVSPTHQVVTPPVQQQQQQQQQPLSLKTFQSSSTQLAKIEEKIQGRGMCRSSASYGIQQMLQDQISREESDAKQLALEKEMTKVVAACEEKINALKAEHNQQIQQILREKTTAINNAKNTFETELQRRTSEIEVALRNQHALELQNDRANSKSEMESLRCQYENALEAAEERHRASVEQFQDRDQAWQTEKQEVLAEIQRLKEEASRFIAILSQEEEYEKSDAQLSPTKRQALTKEVESLQLVVEMRSAEVRQLREERLKLLEQLEAFETTRNILEKMNARVEDLQAQLEAKSQVERQLSLENSKLENCYETESKNKARMSMQVEELQWRIKHNLELPATQIFSPGSPMSMDESHWTEITSGPMSMSANQIHSFDEVMMRKQKPTSRTATSTPRKEYIYSNRNTYEYDVWGKEEKNSNKETNGFSLSSPKKCVNKNDAVCPVVTPTSVENNNQFCDASTHNCDVIENVTSSSEDREKRDRSTEKQIIMTEDEVLIIAADSLENLKSGDLQEAVIGDRKNEDVVIIADLAAEDDEGLGDINHGSEASSSPQPPQSNNNNSTSNNHNNNNHNNNNVVDMNEDFVVVQTNANVVVVDVFDKKTTSTSKMSPSKMSMGSPCDERVPSRIPFSLQTNL